jgi:hypothetical protein
MNEYPAPDPEFVNRLEWELSSVLRRQGTHHRTSLAARLVRSRPAAALALVVLSLFAGGAGTYAALHTVDEQAAALHIARGEALLEIARTRLEPAAGELARIRALAAQGGAAEQEVQQVEMAFLHAQSEVEIGESNLAETRLTGQEPRDALSAPRVGSRDFVTERLAARRLPLQQHLKLTIEQSRRHEELAKAGLVSASEPKAAQLGVVGAEAEVAALEQRIALRAAFLAGELSATEVELKGMRLAAVAARETALRQAGALAEQHQRVALLSERGMAPGSESKAVEAELRAVQAQAELADLELRILDQRLQDASKK